MKKLLIIAMVMCSYWALAAHPAHEPCCEALLSNSGILARVDTVNDAGKTDAQQRVEAELSGQWETLSYPFDVRDEKGNLLPHVEGAYLSYIFQPDGTYTKKMGGIQICLEEKGHWELSADGNRLLMYPTGSLTPAVASIKYLEMDELVLEHAMQCSEKSLCTGMKDFFFNKL